MNWIDLKGFVIDMHSKHRRKTALLMAAAMSASLDPDNTRDNRNASGRFDF